jgi:hypothetical protein
MKIIIEADDDVVLAARAGAFALKNRSDKDPWMIVSTGEQHRAVRFNKSSVRVYKPQEQGK